MRVLVASLLLLCVIFSGARAEPTYWDDFGTWHGARSGSGKAGCVAFQADGKVLVARDQSGSIFLTRFSADGKTTEFDAYLFAYNVAANPFGVLVQADGKIVVVCSYGQGGTNVIRLVRLLSDGTKDPTFGTNGIVLTNLPIYARGVAVLQPDDKILVAASSLIRFKADGTLDEGFGNGGVASGQSSATCLALLPDGKILAGQGIELKRYNPDGIIDTTFGTAGTVSSAEWYAPGIRGILVQPDLKILLSVRTLNGFTYLQRLGPDGKADPGFVTGYSLPAECGRILLQRDGKIIAPGNTFFSISLMRFNANGVPDELFGTHGQATISGRWEQNLQLADAALQPDGKILVTGNEQGESSYSPMTVRLLGGPYAPESSGAALKSTYGDYVALTGRVKSNGALTTVSLQLGLSPGFEKSTAAPSSSSIVTVPGSAMNPVEVTFEFNRLLPETTYYYRLVTENSQGKTFGEIATFTMGAPLDSAPPVFRNSPAPALNSPVASKVFFTVEALGAGTLTYQWFKDGVAIRGATLPALKYEAVNAANAGTYYCLVKNRAGSTKTAPVLLTIQDPTVLIYKIRGSDTFNEKNTSTRKPLSGYLLLDRPSGNVTTVWTNADSYGKYFRIEPRPDVSTHSTGPIPMSTTTVIGTRTTGTLPNVQKDMVWISGRDALVTLSAGKQVIAPPVMSGTAGRLLLGENLSVETLGASLTLDRVTTLASRDAKEDLASATTRVRSLLKSSGYIEQEP